MYGTHAANRFGIRVGCLVVLGWLSATLYLGAQPKIRFPLPNQTFYPDRVLRLEWTNTEAQSVDVLYSQDEGQRWTRIAAGMKDSAFEWNLPLLDTTNVLFKVQTASLRQPEEFQRIDRTRGCISAAWDATDHNIVSALDDALLEVRSPDNLMAIASLPLGSQSLIPARSYIQHPDTVISAQGTDIILHNVAAFGSVVRFGSAEHHTAVRCLCVHPNREIVATATEDGRVYIWSIPERRLMHCFLPEMQSPLNTIAFSSDGHRLLYAGEEGIIFVRAWEDPTQGAQQLRGHGDAGKNQAVTCAAFTPDGHHIVSGGVDFTLRYWDLKFQTPTYVLFGHSAAVTSLKISSDGTRVLSASLDSTVRQWSLGAGRELHSALHMNDAVCSVDYSADADTLLAAERHSGAMVLWRNIRETGQSDSVKGFITYPISVRICNTKATVGEISTIPIVFDSIVSVPFFKRASFRATLGLTIPRRIVAVECTNPEILVLHGDERDTVFMPIVFSSNDTVGRLPVRFLLAENATDQVQILPGRQAIQWSDAVRAFSLDHTTNGVVSSEKECPQTGKGGLSMLAAEESTVWPCPANDHATLRFASYEEGEYNIDVLNELGDVVYVLSSAYYNRGSQSISIPSSEFSSGSYNVRITAPTSTRVRPLLIVH